MFSRTTIAPLQTAHERIVQLQKDVQALRSLNTVLEQALRQEHAYQYRNYKEVARWIEEALTVCPPKPAPAATSLLLARELERIASTWAREAAGLPTPASLGSVTAPIQSLRLYAENLYRGIPLPLPTEIAPDV